MDLRDRKDMLELKRTKLDQAEKQIEDLRRKTVRRKRRIPEDVSELTTVTQDEHVFSMVIIDGDNMPVSIHILTPSPCLAARGSLTVYKQTSFKMNL